MRCRFIPLVFLIAFGLVSALAQDAKPWHEWTKQDVEKILNKSAWGQVQSETDTSGITAAIGTPDPNSALTFNYRIRFFSARPVREAFARQVMLSNPKIQASQLQNFVIGDYSEVIVVAVTFDGADRRYTGIIGQTLDGATAATVQNKAYLERQDGKRVFAEDYAKPSSDGTGAKYVFPRIVDGKPFLTEKDQSIRFVADMGRGVQMSWRFKVADMFYNGKLEY
jgi:hypothetical protein